MQKYSSLDARIFLLLFYLCIYYYYYLLLYTIIIFTFMHLADAFIQRVLQCIQLLHIMLSYYHDY